MFWFCLSSNEWDLGDTASACSSAGTPSNFKCCLTQMVSTDGNMMSHSVVLLECSLEQCVSYELIEKYTTSLKVLQNVFFGNFNTGSHSSSVGIIVINLILLADHT